MSAYLLRGITSADCRRGYAATTGRLRLGRVEIIEDFLPPPDQLVLRDDGVKITIALSKRSVDFFKRQAARSKVPYQKMIRSLLDGYARRYETEL